MDEIQILVPGISSPQDLPLKIVQPSAAVKKI